MGKKLSWADKVQRASAKQNARDTVRFDRQGYKDPTNHTVRKLNGSRDKRYTRNQRKSEEHVTGLCYGFLSLAIIGFVILFFLPELFAGTTFFVGWQCIKWVKNRKFNPYCKSGMIATLAVISTVPAYVGGLELHKEMEFDRGSMIQHVIETNFGDKN
jgi:hypothetical protein